MNQMPLCDLCVHYQGGLNDAGVQKCAAFPQGIPDGITIDLLEHFEPIAGEQIVFSPRPDVTPEMVQEWVELAGETRVAISPRNRTDPEELV